MHKRRQKECKNHKGENTKESRPYRLKEAVIHMNSQKLSQEVCMDLPRIWGPGAERRSGHMPSPTTKLFPVQGITIRD